jgi:hypothetical protein
MIRQNIIGHGAAAGGNLLGTLSRVSGEDGAFAVFDQPASEHGGRVFLEPLIEEFADLLAQIGGVAEAGEFIGLQSVARSGEKEFPGSLGVKLGHRSLPEDGLRKYRHDNNPKVKDKASTFRTTGLWKVVQKKEKGIGVCSGCAGDYEDPDRSAWEADEEEEGDRGSKGGGGEAEETK